MRKRNATIMFGICSLFSGLASADTFTINVSLNTSALVSDIADQDFGVDFYMENGALITANQPGGPHTPPSNIVTISNFNFGGGSAFAAATDPGYATFGGASGDINSQVKIFDNTQNNEFFQDFTPGSTLSFTVTYTNNVANSDLVDDFEFGITDNNGVDIPTQGGFVLDAFLEIDFDSDVPDIFTSPSDPNVATSNGQFLTIAAPTVTSSAVTVPEPGSFWLMGTVLLIVAFGKIIWAGLRKSQGGPVLGLLLVIAAFGSRGLMAQSPPAPELFTTLYNDKPVTYQIINGFAVVQGDMIIGEARVQIDREGHRSASLIKYHADSNTINLANGLWPKAAGVVTIPYTTTLGSPNMTTAINQFNALFAGQFKWVPKTTQKDYVEINLNNQSPNSCYAALGRVGGKEDIQGQNGCNVAALLHEMGHIMGFAHEQSRANRASYIFIDFSNIAPASQSQYTQDFSSTMDLGLYDYSSLMHYGPRGFTRNGNPEMESIPVGITFGVSQTYSTGDIDALNRIYFGPPSVITITSNPPGLPIIVDGATVTAPQSFSWSLNSSHTLNVPPGPQTIGGSSYIFGRWNSDLNMDLSPSRTITITPGSGMFGSPSSSPANTTYQVNYIQLAQYNPTPLLDNTFSTTSAAGSVSTNPAPATYPGLTGQYFVSRQLVTLTATPAAGNSFYDFDGPNTFAQTFGPSTNPVTLPSDLIAGTLYTAFASQPEVMIATNITSNNASGASVTADGSPKSLPAAWSAANDPGWTPGSTHSVTAATPVNPFFDPNTVYTFTGWTDGFSSPTRTVTVPNSGLLSVGVNYSTSYHVSASVNTACGGSVSATPTPPANGFILAGSPIILSATPTSPFVFAGWGGTLSGSTNPLNTSAGGEIVALANFNLIGAPLTFGAISPASLPAGSPAQSITISGSGFTPANTSFYLNDSSRVVTYVNANTITVALLASDLATPRALTTIIENLSAGGCPVDAYGNAFLVTP